MMYLIKFSDNWADEMDVEGFVVLSEEDKNECFDFLKREYGEGGDVYFGTNQYKEYKSLEKILEQYDIDEISEDEAKLLENFFGKRIYYGYGHIGPLM